jgi:hypothetical protein
MGKAGGQKSINLLPPRHFYQGMDEGMPWLALACGLNKVLLMGKLAWTRKTVALAAKNAAAAAAMRCCLCMVGLAVVEKRARSLFMLSVSRCHCQVLKHGRKSSTVLPTRSGQKATL